MYLCMYLCMYPFHTHTHAGSSGGGGGGCESALRVVFSLCFCAPRFRVLLLRLFVRSNGGAAVMAPIKNAYAETL